jgi:hypothetical protein
MIRWHRFLLLLVFSFFLWHPGAQAQDRIVKINNDTIRARVLRITTDKIIYAFPGTRPEHYPEIHKNQVKEIIYANGTRVKIIYNQFAVSPDLFIHARAHVIKVDVASFLLNHLTVGYEQRLKAGLNLEVKGGLIGPGINKQLDEAEGFLVKAGVKFVQCGTSYKQGRTYTDPLKGSYLKPEVIFSRFTVKTDADITYTNWALNLVLGKQYIPWEGVSLEFFGGLGFGTQSSSYSATSPYDKKEKDFNYAYSHLYFGRELPVVISGGITAGFVF